MIKRSFLFIALLLWSMSKGFGQQKFEKEYRINSEDVPSAAINFLQKITDKKRLKWVAEESQDGKTIEAKFYKNRRKYSVEFDKQGQLIDIEILISVSNLPASEKVLLEKTLGNEFAKFSILKIQKQFKNITFDQIESFFNSKENKDFDTYDFEVVVKGKSKDRFELYELLLSKSGTLLKKLKFGPQNSLNLQF